MGTGRSGRTSWGPTVICGPVEGPITGETALLFLLMSALSVGGALLGLSIIKGARQEIDARFPGAPAPGRRLLGTVLTILSGSFFAIIGLMLVRALVCP
jgi:hypothetical protein